MTNLFIVLFYNLIMCELKDQKGDTKGMTLYLVLASITLVILIVGWFQGLWQYDR